MRRRSDTTVDRSLFGAPKGIRNSLESVAYTWVSTWTDNSPGERTGDSDWNSGLSGSKIEATVSNERAKDRGPRGSSRRFCGAVKDVPKTMDDFAKPNAEVTDSGSSALAEPVAKSHKPGASAPCWDLSDLYRSVSDPQIEADLAAGLEMAEALSADFRGRIAVPGGPGPQLMAEALSRYEAVLEKIWKTASYAHLMHSADSRPPENGALYARCQELATKAETILMFLELDWISLPDGDAAPVIASSECARWKHYLSSSRRYKPHTLSEPEEIILTEKRLTGIAAFRRFFDEINSSAKFKITVEGEKRSVNQSEALALLYSPDREVRIEGHRGFSEGLRKMRHSMVFILNNVVQDHAVDNRLRRFEHPADPRHLSNEIDRRSVAVLMDACEAGGHIVRDYYRLKAKLLGLNQLFDYDRYAPVQIEGSGIPACAWDSACSVVVKAFTDFSPILGDIAADFIEKRWIDAEIRAGKRGGAFCSPGVPSIHPYILTNFTGKLNDAMTLAHELGHGVHQYLSRDKGILQCSTPLTLAETASVFGEMLVFQRLVSRETNHKIRLALYCNRLEDAFATVFRQVALTRFEEKVHAARAKGELTGDEIDRLWLEANESMLGEAVKTTEGYRLWWSYIGHFVHSPFYCYAYSFGELLVLSLWSQYQREGSSFVPKYLELLRSGGTDSPANLISKVGLDINEASFWRAGISVLEGMLEEAKRLAAEYL